jgi:hypothetical protein
MPQDLTPAVKPTREIIEGCDWTPNVSSIGDASGSASGSVSSADEAWCRTTQTFDSDYVRVPSYTKPAALDLVGLSQVSAVDNINQTMLYHVTTLHNKQEKVYLPVGTSGFTQYQTLALNAQSTDQYANSYGVVSGFIMGPQGSLNTIKPFIKQEKWNDLAHHEHDITQVGSTFGLVQASSLEWQKCTELGDPLSVYITMRAFWRGLEIGNLFGGNPGWNAANTYFKENFVGPRYKLNGAYNTSAEYAWNDIIAGKSQVIYTIQQLVNCFTASSWYNRAGIPVPTLSNGSEYIVEGDRVAQNIYYDTLRHDYS